MLFYKKVFIYKRWYYTTTINKAYYFNKNF